MDYVRFDNAEIWLTTLMTVGSLRVRLAACVGIFGGDALAGKPETMWPPPDIKKPPWAGGSSNETDQLAGGSTIILPPRHLGLAVSK